MPDAPVEQVLSRAEKRATTVLVFEERLLSPSGGRTAWRHLVVGGVASARVGLPVIEVPAVVVGQVLGRARESLRFCLRYYQLTRSVGPNSPQKAASKLEGEPEPFYTLFYTESSNETE